MSALFVVGMLILGGAVGLISSALGLGGGIFMVPAFFEFVPGMDAGTAKGTSLFIIVFVAAVNVWRLNRGHSDRHWGLAAVIASGSIVGAYASGWATSLLRGTAVLWPFIGLLGLIGARTFFLKEIRIDDEDVRRRFLVAVLIGVATGIVAGATGVGGGAILVPLALLAGIVTNERVVALSNTVMVATCAAGALAHFRAERVADLPWVYGQVNIALVPLVFIGAQVAGPFGKWINERLPLHRRKVVMGLLLIVIAGRMVYRALTG
ncbi:MAG: sulfite exporter TauE/SafE family protein [Candidatus Hydrogenedentes bacterium]|nr:sulfite exporter TauE/SafE family protein [Candidatus Hydrogenedentota bacterium]